MSRYNIFAQINFEIDADSREEAEEIYLNLPFWDDEDVEAEEWSHEIEYLGDSDE